MPPKNAVTSEDQLKYVIACLKHNDTAIKPNFQKVADECGIITKAAASKRWERLMKAHGIAPASLGGQKRKAEDEDDTPLTPTSPLAAVGKNRSSTNHSDTSAEDKSASKTNGKKQKESKGSVPKKTKVKTEQPEHFEPESEPEQGLDSPLATSGKNSSSSHHSDPSAKVKAAANTHGKKENQKKNKGTAAKKANVKTEQQEPEQNLKTTEPVDDVDDDDDANIV